VRQALRFSLLSDEAILVVEVNFKSSEVVSELMESSTNLRTTDPLTVGDIARRSGFADSAVRYYERLGLLHATRTAGGQRRFERSTLRRLAFIRAARNIGLSLDEVAAALSSLPSARTPNRADWARLSRGWRERLDEQIEALVALRDGLDSCIGCGCLSLDRCAISNPADSARSDGPGAAYLPAGLRREDGRP
jgi:MerR family transcriptional regulator, redox-sensitive transcriptional activator SoxR